MKEKIEKVEHPDFSATFERFTNRYRDKFGQNKMSDDTCAMFYDKLCLYDPKQFETVTAILLGSNEWNFSWKRIVERFTILFPSEENQKALEATWKLEHDKNPRKEMTAALAHLQTCMPDLAKKNPKTWREDYYKKHVEICGVEESLRITHAKDFPFIEFRQWIYENYRKEEV